MHPFRSAALLLALLLTACSVGSRTPSALRDIPPAPTTIPLPSVTTAPSTAASVATAAETTATTAATSAAAANDPQFPTPKPITLPPGFTASVYSQDVGKARGLALGPDGHAYLADIGGGRILRLATMPTADGLHPAEAVITGLDQPHSLAFHDGALYVGETNQVARFTPDGDGWGNKTVIVPNLPTGGHHTRTVLFGADGKLYVSIGSSCNVCDEDDDRRATVMQYDADGSNGRIYTAGLRNAVGLAINPATKEIWASNNGRDMLGDDLPPETVNVLADGADFGWPRCHAGRIVDPDFGGAAGCENVKAPAVEMQAHSAPLGLAFYTGTQFPADYQGNVLVAFHGSWNRTKPTGYKIVRVTLDAQGNAGAVQDFAVGWRDATGDVWGRPVDLLVLPDGSLLVSDDASGMVFRIAYQG